MIPEAHRFISWGRYLFWAQLARQQFTQQVETTDTLEDPTDKWLFFALASQWYARLWVVVEGWRELDLSDPLIEELFKNSAYMEMLRRYRNVIFHFQPDMLDQRFLTLWQDNPNLIPWIHALHDEFLRFFDGWFETIGDTTDRVKELRETVKQGIGWVPSQEESITSRIREVKQLASDALTMTQGDNSETAQRLKEAASLAETMADQTKDRISKGFFKLLKNPKQNQ